MLWLSFHLITVTTHLSTLSPLSPFHCVTCPHACGQTFCHASGTLPGGLSLACSSVFLFLRCSRLRADYQRAVFTWICASLCPVLWKSLVLTVSWVSSATRTVPWLFSHCTQSTWISGIWHPASLYLQPHFSLQWEGNFKHWVTEQTEAVGGRDALCVTFLVLAVSQLAFTVSPLSWHWERLLSPIWGWFFSTVQTCLFQLSSPTMIFSPPESSNSFPSGSVSVFKYIHQLSTVEDWPNVFLAPVSHSSHIS